MEGNLFQHYDDLAKWFQEKYDIKETDFTKENIDSYLFKKIIQCQGVKNELISMQEDLIKGKAAEGKKRKLETKYNIIMSGEFEGRLSQIYNLSG